MIAKLRKKQLKLQITEFFSEKGSDVCYLSEFSNPKVFYSLNNDLFQNHLLLYSISSISKDERQRLHNLAFQITKIVFEKKIQFLNKIHQKDYSKKFWWILISPWLLQFINQLLLYCHVIENALLKTKPNTQLKCKIIEPKYWTRFYDTKQTLNAWKGDRQNHEILSFILWCKKSSKIKKNIVSDEKVRDCKRHKSRKRNLVGKLLHNFVLPIILFFNKIFHKNALGFGTPSESKLMDLTFALKSKFFFIPIYDIYLTKKEDSVFCKGDFPKESSIKHLINEFEKVALSAFELFIPNIFLDDFESFSKSVFKPLKFTNFRAMASSTDWYFNEVFKFAAALAAENGAMTIGMQHGGNYGIEMNHPVLQFELYKRDTYITWGWEKTDFKHYTNIKPLPSLKLLALTRKKQKNKINKKILFCASETPIFPRWLIRDDFKQGLDRVASQFEFFYELGNEIRKQTTFRLNTNDLGWNQISKVRNRFPEIKNESFKVPFVESLNNSSAFVTNILSTTYVQSFVANIPSLLILNSELNKFTTVANEYLSDLESVGVLHYSGKSAGTFLRKNINNIDYWWHSDNTQRAVLKFTKKFLCSTDNGLEEWNNFFLNLKNETYD